MGCKHARVLAPFYPNEHIPGQGHDAVETFKSLQLSREEINWFFKVFQRIDTDNSGEVDLEEFAKFFEFDRSFFADQVFRLFDEDGSGEVNFEEFVVSLWNFCSFDVSSLIKFAFDLFDADGSGELSLEEVYELVLAVYGEVTGMEAKFKRLMQELDTDGSGTVELDEFAKFNMENPVLLYPAYTLQKQLRDKVLGVQFWREQLKKRLKVGNGKIATLEEMLKHKRKRK